MNAHVFYILLVATIFSICSCEEWTGRWFPDIRAVQEMGGPPMGVINSSCDDGVGHLETDYDGSPVNYTCYDDKDLYRPNSAIHPLLEHERIPRGYHALHRCMDTQIIYDRKIPTFGPHRPLWPKYGEYNFVPVQRWLHTLEHGGIVMLYHPCADRNEVNILKRMVKNCLYKHVITANSDLSPQRPLALISWGYRLTFSKVKLDIVVKFVRNHANRGSETTSRDGQYSLGLLKHSQFADEEDKELCPLYNVKLLK